MVYKAFFVFQAATGLDFPNRSYAMTLKECRIENCSLTDAWRLHDIELRPDTTKVVVVDCNTEGIGKSIPWPLKVQLCHMPLLPQHRPPPTYLQRPIHIHQLPCLLRQ